MDHNPALNGYKKRCQLSHKKEIFNNCFLKTSKIVPKEVERGKIGNLVGCH